MLLTAVVQLHSFGATNDAARFDIRPAIASRNFRKVSERHFIRFALQIAGVLLQVTWTCEFRDGIPLGPTSVVVHMSRMVNVSIGDPVVGLGAGTVGAGTVSLLCGAVARYWVLKSDFGRYQAKI